MSAHRIGGGREQSRPEEVANTISHALGLIAGIVAAPVLLVHTVQRGDGAHITGAALFSAALLLLYFVSTLYHALPVGSAKRVLQLLDHSSIYLLIAGTYSPFTLGVLRGAWGWSLFGVIWGLAAFGIALKVMRKLDRPVLSTGLYVAMGWLVVIAADPLLSRMPRAGLIWLLAGGLSYTLGVAFYATDSRVRFGHFVWHLFVLGGTVCHYVAVLRYSA